LGAQGGVPAFDISGLQRLQQRRADVRVDLPLEQLTKPFGGLRANFAGSFPLLDARGDMLADGDLTRLNEGLLVDRRQQLAEPTLGIAPLAFDCDDLNTTLAIGAARKVEFDAPRLSTAAGDVSPHRDCLRCSNSCPMCSCSSRKRFISRSRSS